MLAAAKIRLQRYRWRRSLRQLMWLQWWIVPTDHQPLGFKVYHVVSAGRWRRSLRQPMWLQWWIVPTDHQPLGFTVYHVVAAGRPVTVASIDRIVELCNS
jgi:hypothetical protein